MGNCVISLKSTTKGKKCQRCKFLSVFTRKYSKTPLQKTGLFSDLTNYTMKIYDFYYLPFSLEKFYFFQIFGAATLHMAWGLTLSTPPQPEYMQRGGTSPSPTTLLSYISSPRLHSPPPPSTNDLKVIYIGVN